MTREIPCFFAGFVNNLRQTPESEISDMHDILTGIIMGAASVAVIAALLYGLPVVIRNRRRNRYRRGDD